MTPPPDTAAPRGADDLAEAVRYVRYVFDAFETDLRQGYRTKDKEFAVSLLKPALALFDVMPVSAAEPPDQDTRTLDAPAAAVEAGAGEGAER